MITFFSNDYILKWKKMTRDIIKCLTSNRVLVNTTRRIVRIFYNSNLLFFSDIIVALVLFIKTRGEQLKC